MATEYFDIDATVPSKTPKSELNGMLQSLLTERFDLVQHSESKEGPGYALAIGKGGPRLKTTG